MKPTALLCHQAWGPAAGLLRNAKSQALLSLHADKTTVWFVCPRKAEVHCF